MYVFGCGATPTSLRSKEPGLSSLNEGQVVEYEEVSNRGKSNTK